MNLQCLATRLANVRTFTGVNANVNCQSGALDKSLAALAKVTGEGAFLAVDASMSEVSEIKMIKVARQFRKVSFGIPQKVDCMSFVCRVHPPLNIQNPNTMPLSAQLAVLQKYWASTMTSKGHVAGRALAAKLSCRWREIPRGINRRCRLVHADCSAGATLNAGQPNA